MGVLGHARRRGAGDRRGRHDRRPHRARQDRHGAGVGRAGTDAPAARCRRDRAQCRAARPELWLRWSGRVLGHSRRRLEGVVGGHHARDGDAARGVPGRAHRLPGARRVAFVEEQRPHATDAGHRDAGVSDGPVHRQDRDDHAEPHDRQRAAHARGRTVPHRRPAGSGGVPSAWSSSRCSRRPVDPFDPDGHRVQGAGSAVPVPDRASPRGLAPRARVPAVRAAAGALTRLALPGRRRLRHRGQGRARGDRRPVPSATRWPRARCRATWRISPRTACGCSASRGRPSAPAAGLPEDQHDFVFGSWAWWGCTIPSAARRARSDRAGAPGRHACRDDHRRLPGHGAGHRAPGRPRRRRAGAHRAGARRDGRRRPRRARRIGGRLRARRARAEAPHRACSEGARATSSR